MFEYKEFTEEWKNTYLHSTVIPSFRGFSHSELQRRGCICLAVYTLVSRIHPSLQSSQFMNICDWDFRDKWSSPVFTLPRYRQICHLKMVTYKQLRRELCFGLYYSKIQMGDLWYVHHFTDSPSVSCETYCKTNSKGLKRKRGDLFSKGQCVQSEQQLIWHIFHWLSSLIHVEISISQGQCTCYCSVK